MKVFKNHLQYFHNQNVTKFDVIFAKYTQLRYLHTMIKIKYMVESKYTQYANTKKH